MVPEKQIEQFVSRLKQAAGGNLISVVLYGSAATGDFRPDFSNVNLLAVLRTATFTDLAALAPATEWWHAQKHHSPLLLTREEIERSADVFSIEFLDMKERHRLLFGEDVLSTLEVPMHLHRAQLEYELREKLILLRERLLLAVKDDVSLWKLMLGSVSTFTTLFRHALIAFGESAPHHKSETVSALAKKISFDPSPFETLLAIRHDPKHQRPDAKQTCTLYLSVIEKVTAAVDKMLDSAHN